MARAVEVGLQPSHPGLGVAPDFGVVGKHLSHERDFAYLTREDIQACLAYAADRERSQLVA